MASSGDSPLSFPLKALTPENRSIESRRVLEEYRRDINACSREISPYHTPRPYHHLLSCTRNLPASLPFKPFTTHLGLFGRGTAIDRSFKLRPVW